MGFRDSQTISTIHFFLLLFFFSLGAFFIILPWTHEFRYAISDLLLNKPEVFFSAGCLVLMITMVFGFGFYSLHRQRSLRVKMDPGLVEIDPDILRAYLETYWKEHHPDKEIQTQVLVAKSQKLEIVVHTAGLEDSKSFLADSEKEIGQILTDIFSYQRAFTFTLTTQS